MGPMSQSRRLPDFLIVGAQKSGTTTLLQGLNLHPEVFCVPEVHFFCDRYQLGLEWYAEKLAAGSAKRLLGEKCPHYLSHAEAPARIAETVPGVKLIVILRDPVRRAYAHYWHHRRRRQEGLTFAEALAAEDNRVAQGDDNAAYLGRSRYLPQLQRLCLYHPRDSLQVILFEEFLEKPTYMLNEVCSFLDVPAFNRDVELPRANAYRQQRPEWLGNVMSRYRLWNRMPSWVALRLWNAMTHEPAYEPIDPVLERELREELAPHNRALANWLNRDLDVWAT